MHNNLATTQTVVVLYDAEGPEDATVAAVLLHPHPHFGGDRHHPFVSGLYTKLPAEGIAVVRFDFTSADPETACEQVVGAIDVGSARWSRAAIVIAGYSFGAGIGLRVDDQRVGGWFLVAPPAQMLPRALVGESARPKHIVVPKRDQFSSLGAVEDATAAWAATEIDVVADDHYLWNVMDDVVRSAVRWIGALGGHRPTNGPDPSAPFTGAKRTQGG